MSLVSLDSLKILCDVAQQRSFSRGAEMNNVSQSAVSQTIRQIEDHLGTRLIDRSTRPFKLTAAGEIYWRECREILDRYMALEARVRARQSDTDSRLRVAAIYSVLLCDMNRYVEAFLRYEPKGAVRFRYMHPDDVYDSVLNDEADLGLLSFPRPSRDVAIVPWREEPMTLVCAPNHRFARLKTIKLAQLAGEDFVAFESGLAIQREIDRFLKERGVSVNPVMAFDNIEFIKRGVETGAGVAILPAATVRNEFRNGSLATVTVQGLDLKRSLSVVYRVRRPLSPAAQLFIDVLRESSEAEVAVSPRPRVSGLRTQGVRTPDNPPPPRRPPSAARKPTEGG